MAIVMEVKCDILLWLNDVCSNDACIQFGMIMLYETYWFEYRIVLFGPLSLAGYNAGEILFGPSSLAGYNADEMISGFEPSKQYAGGWIRD